jgi:hypothetical protein
MILKQFKENVYDEKDKELLQTFSKDIKIFPFPPHSYIFGFLIPFKI